MLIFGTPGASVTRESMSHIIVDLEKVKDPHFKSDYFLSLSISGVLERRVPYR